MIENSYIVGNKEKFDHGIIVLPGRGTSCMEMHKLCSYAGICEDNLLLHLEPFGRVWYPMPNGIYDQKDAVEGLPEASEVVNNMIDNFMDLYKIEENKISVIGYSAGAVVAIDVSFRRNFKNIVSLAGAILEPENVAPCQNQSEYHLQHDYLDTTFDWIERYEPMKNALITNGYKAFLHETSYYGHNSFNQDVLDVLGSIFKKSV